jgi:hypothetical protein
VNWQPSSAYSERAAGTDYHVSRSHGRDPITGEPEVRYSAWHGPLLREQDRANWRWPALLGIFGTAEEARAACEARG